jgi:hypothetical protein
LVATLEQLNANLAMLKALSQIAEWRDSQASRTGAEALLTLWN